MPYGTSWPPAYGVPVEGVVSENGLRTTSSSMYSTFGLFARPFSAVVGTSMAIASMLMISCLTEPFDAATSDLIAAFAPRLKDTITRGVLRGGSSQRFVDEGV